MKHTFLDSRGHKKKTDNGIVPEEDRNEHGIQRPSSLNGHETDGTSKDMTRVTSLPFDGIAIESA